jgi:hypothetical protein
MPPLGRDEQVQAIHVLAVVDAARALAVAIVGYGGIAKATADAPKSLASVLCALHDQVSRLAQYEIRASARGTVTKLDDEKLSLAVHRLRNERDLSVDEEEIRDMTDEDAAAAFTVETDAPAVSVDDEGVFRT